MYSYREAALIRTLWLGVLLATLASGLVFAHAKISATLPADGDFVAAPETLHLTFDNVVNLTGIEIVTVDGGRLTVANLPADPATQFSIGVPDTLAPGEYFVVWKAIAADTHFSTGEFFFTVIED